MISITTESGAVFTAPDSLDEITLKELFLLVLEHQRLILADIKAGLVEAEKHHRLGLIYHLFKINYWDWVDLSEADQQKFLVATSWIDQARVRQLPFSYFDFQGVRYYIPKPGYADSCAVEVALANIWYVSFAHPKQPNTEAFFHLLATMYRPAAHPPKRWYEFWKPRPDVVRKEYSSDESEAQAQVFKQLPYGLALVLLQYWETINNDFLTRYRDLFDSDDDGAPMYQGGEGWIATLEEVAEIGTYGTTEKVFLENVHTVFGFLRRKQIKVRSMESSNEVS